jgi:predicted GIY-YIG superfamily endonuclease
MMSNKTRSARYVGVTNGLLVRVAQHRRGEIAGFTRDYHCISLIRCEHFRDLRCDRAGEAIEGMAAREEKCAYCRNESALG